jgi:hypothetical protein
VDDGVIIMEVYPSDAILNSLHIELLKNFYRIGYFKSTGNTEDFFIYSKTNRLQDSVITDTKGIYTGYFFAIEKKKGQLSPEEWSDFLKTKKSEAPNWFSASFSIALVSRKDILPITKNMKDFIRERILNVHDEDDEKIERPFKISLKRSAKKSPKRSAKRSFKKSPKRSAKRSKNHLKDRLKDYPKDRLKIKGNRCKLNVSTKKGDDYFLYFINLVINLKYFKIFKKRFTFLLIIFIFFVVIFFIFFVITVVIKVLIIFSKKFKTV